MGWLVEYSQGHVLAQMFRFVQKDGQIPEIVSCLSSSATCSWLFASSLLPMRLFPVHSVLVIKPDCKFTEIQHPQLQPLMRIKVVRIPACTQYTVVCRNYTTRRPISVLYNNGVLFSCHLLLNLTFLSMFYFTIA